MDAARCAAFLVEPESNWAAVFHAEMARGKDGRLHVREGSQVCAFPIYIFFLVEHDVTLMSSLDNLKTMICL